MSSDTRAALQWERLHQVSYRRRHIWEMKWRTNSNIGIGVLQFRDRLVAASTNGGPIAVLRPKQQKQLGNDLAFENKNQAISIGELQTYTAGGSLISTAPWNYERMVSMCWSDEAMLVCIFESGVVRVFSVFCSIIYCFNLDDRVKSEGGVLSAIISPTASTIIVLTRALRLYANFSLSHRACFHLPDPPIASPPLAMAICPIQSGASRISLLLASESGPLYSIDQIHCRPLPSPHGPFIALTMSPSGKLVAAQSRENYIYIFLTSSDFSTVVDCASLPNIQGKLKQLTWISDDCLASHIVTVAGAATLQYRHSVIFGGPGNQWITYEYDTDIVRLVSEIDSLRVITLSKTDIIERVASSTENVFGTDSCKPGALLYYAWQQYESGHTQANDILVSVLPDFPEAIEECIHAATRETDSAVIIPLLRAVTFGRLYMRENFLLLRPAKDIPGSKTSSGVKKDGSQLHTELARERRRLCRLYLEACRDLRVTIALHSMPLEMCISVYQLRQQTPNILLKVLAHRRMHLLAIRIGEFLGIGRSRGEVKVYSPIEVDCSQEVRDICASFWVTPGLQKLTDAAEDCTRPAGVALALKRPSGGWRQGLSSYSLTTTCKLPSSKESEVDNDSPMWYVLEHWAREKISSSIELTDKQLLDLLHSTLQEYDYLQPRMVKIALAAARLSRPNLATLLLQYEPRSRVQVRILLRLAETDLAFKQAIAAGDPDLIFECLAMLEAEAEHNEIRTYTDFTKLLSVLHMYPILWDYYEILCIRAGKLQWLQQLYENDGAVEKAGWICLIRALSEPQLNVENKKRHLAHSAAFFGSGKDSTNQRVDLKLAQQLTLEHLELLNIQKELELIAVTKSWSRQPCHLEGLTLAQTLKELFSRNAIVEAEKLQTMFTVSPKRALRIRVEALLENNLTEELCALAESKTNQVLGGVDFFIRALQKAPASEPVGRMISTLTRMSTKEKAWLPKMFQTFDTEGSTTHSKDEQRQSQQRQRGTGLQAAAGSLMGSLSEAFGR